MPNHAEDLIDDVPHRPIWPLDVTADDVPEVAFDAGLTRDPNPAVALLRFLRIGDRVIAGSVVWSSAYSDIERAAIHVAWLRRHPEERDALARRIPLIGDAEVLTRIEVGLELDRVAREREAALMAARLESERVRADAAAEKSRLIDSYLVERKGQFGIDLRRGDAASGFYVILFRERWERERFRDWFRWQRHRYAEWTEYLETHPAIELDRILIAEMLTAERRIKADGLSAGGRRPLRFWRGDSA